MRSTFTSPASTSPSRNHALRRLAVTWLVALAIVGVHAREADAQYFGRNKVLYDQFDFQVIETEHFDVHYYSTEAAAAQQVAQLAERWYTRLSTVLQHSLSTRQPLVIYASHPEFEQTNVVEGMISEGTGGVTEGMLRRVVLPLAASLRETDHVLGHEIVHAFQYDMLGQNIQRMPLWVVEGLAEYLSLGGRDAQTAMWLRDAAREDRLPDIGDLDDPRYFPYRFGHAFWAYIGGRFGDSAVTSILQGLATDRQGGGPDPVAVIEAITGQKKDALAEAWHASVRETYGVAAREKNAPEPVPAGQRLLREREAGTLDLGPALSPSGQRIAFLSEQGRLAIDLYVADIDGRNVKQITRSAVDPHFESLQFLASAGSWSPDNRHLAVAAVRQGRGVLAIFDADEGRLVREIPLPATGEVFNPSWSPAGGHIAFSAQIGGYTDLFVANTEDYSIRQLTKDAFADLQPVWSPDGQRLAFVTDRFSSNLDRLTFGYYELGVVDVASGRVTPLVTQTAGDLTNPAWIANDALVFVSTASGRPEVMRQREGATGPDVVASVLTGVAGITPLSSALSVSRETATVAFTVFGAGGYQIRLTPTDASADTRASGDLAVLPPGERRPVATLAAGSAIPPSTSFQQRPYRASLGLVDIGQALGIGAGSGSYGTYVSGGISMLFSDVLGNHLVPATVSVNGRVQDIAAQLAYLNRGSRWTWGVFGERVPLVSGEVLPSFQTIDGQTLYVETTNLFRQTATQVGALTAYPFSRTMRLEFATSARHIGFTQESEEAFFDPVTGTFLGESSTSQESAPSLRLVDASAALVRDNSVFGAVSPILGQRFRFEAAPTWGDLELVDVTADFRQYVSPVRPLTFAVRALHLARYGGDAEDERLWPFFLGYPTFIRGYDADSFTATDCTPSLVDPCPELNGLAGSRVAVVNIEARMPLFGFAGGYNYGPIPAEIFAFLDAGTAWTRAAGIVPDDRSAITRSVGVGARVNLLGFAIGEFNLAKPLDRRSAGWQFVFNLRPGY